MVPNPQTVVVSILYIPEGCAVRSLGHGFGRRGGQFRGAARGPVHVEALPLSTRTFQGAPAVAADRVQ